MPRNTKLTLTSAKQAVRPLGFTLTKHENEYRLAPVRGSAKQRQERAYFTNDLADAVATAAHEKGRE
jgi:hypothetical protein